MAAGVPTVALLVAENQRAGAAWLAHRGATELLDPAELDALEAEVRRLSGDPELRHARACRARELVDGHGALRVAFLLWRLLRMSRSG
jgi:spore coat polysaccharide biosynthesis predicted glycosyltransferase SpsG